MPVNLNNSLQAQVQINRVNLENTTIENEDKTIISLQSVFSELVFDRSSFQWHQDQNYLDLLRVRYVLCMSNRNARALDYIAQRFSEYQEKTRLEATPANPRERNLNLEEMYNTTTINLLGGSTYRDNQDLLGRIDLGDQQVIAGGSRRDYLLGSRIRAEFEPPSVYPYQNVSPSVIYRRPLHYNEDRRLRDLITYDAPLDSLLSRDSNGNINLTQDRSNLSNPNGRGHYVRQNCTLNEIKIKIGEGEPFTNTDFEHLSIYAFVYLDMDAYNQQFNLDPVDNPQGAESSVFYMGMGPIFAGTYVGNKVIYQPIEIFTSTGQQGQRVYTTSPQTIGPEIIETVSAPSATRLDDLRMPQRSNRQLFQDPKNPLYKRYLIFRERANERVYQIISRNAIGEQNNKILKKQNYFTNLWMSKDNSDNVRYIFGFDLQKYMANNATFPALYINPNSQQELLAESRSMIKNMVIKRRKLKKSSYQNTNDLGTYGKENPQTVTETNPEYIIGSPRPASVPFLNLDNLLESEQTSIMFYEGIDTFQNLDNNAPLQEKMSLRQIFGKFEYGVEMVIEDPSLNYVLRRVNTLKSTQKQFSDILSRYVNSPDLYDFSNNRLLLSADDFAILRGLIETYIGVLNDFGVPDLDFVSQTLNLVLASQRPGALDEIQRMFGNLLHELSTLVENNYGIIETVKSAIVDISARGTYENKIPLSTTEHYFESNIEYGLENGFGVDYFNGSYGESSGPLMISVANYLDRAEREFSKYFYRERLRPEDPEPGLTFSQGSYDSPGLSYFSPRIIYRPGKEPIDQLYYFPFDKKNIAEYNLNTYAELMVDIVQAQHKTKYLNFVFYEDHQGNIPPSNKAKSLLQSDESCVILDTEQAEFTVPRPSTRPDLFRLNVERFPLVVRGLVPGILGGLNLSPIDQTFIDERQQEETNTDVIQPDLINIYDIDPREALNPVKLIYGFFGELEISPKLSTDSYMDQAFNSFTNLREQLQLTNNSLNQRLASDDDLGFLPNQIKSMLVVGTTEEQTLLQGIFDARRIFLRDKDFADEDAQNIFADDKISFFAPRTGDNNPPFSITEDPMKIYAKFLAFWLNYKNLAVIEYLSGFEDLANNSTDNEQMVEIDNPEPPAQIPLRRPNGEVQRDSDGNVIFDPDPNYQERITVPLVVAMGYDNVPARQPLGNIAAPLRTNAPKRPVWKTVNRRFINALEQGPPRKVLCRIRTLDNQDLLDSSVSYQDSNVKFVSETPEALRMPTYNNYFFLANDIISRREPNQIPYTTAPSQVPEVVAERRRSLARAGEDTPAGQIAIQTETLGRMDAETLVSPVLASDMVSEAPAPSVQGSSRVASRLVAPNLSAGTINTQNIQQIARNLVFSPRGIY